jgi:hypothetical protein
VRTTIRVPFVYGDGLAIDPGSQLVIRDEPWVPVVRVVKVEVILDIV